MNNSNIFQSVLLNKDTAKKAVLDTSLVFSKKHLILAFEYSLVLGTIRLLNKYRYKINGADLKLKELYKQLRQLGREMNLNADQRESFKPLQYLRLTASTYGSFRLSEEYEFLPSYLRRNLKPVFEYFSAYKFFEEYLEEIAGSPELLFRSIYDLTSNFLNKFSLSGKFYWDLHPLDFVFDFYYAVETFEVRRLINDQLSEAQVKTIFAEYVSSEEVQTMGVDVKSLELDVNWCGSEIETLSGNAVVIGNDPDEYVTIFPHRVPFDHFLIVTGPLYGSAYNRTIYSVTIQDDQTLKRFVDKWIRDGLD